MLMHTQDPITLGTGEIVSFDGKRVLVTTPDGATDGGKLTRADLTRLMTANHELAHALAAVSVGCHIHDLRITSSTGRAFRDGTLSGQLGYVDALHTEAPENAFITLAGWAWEVRYGIPRRAKPDYEAAKQSLTQPANVEMYGDRWEEIQERADAFVQQHKDFIANYAVDLTLTVATDQGKLGKKALRGLNGQLRGYLGNEIRRRL